MDKPISSNDLSALVDVDRLVHEPARLMILANLYVVESADFVFLMNQVRLTWGNLSAHLTKLEEAEYLEMEKTFKGKRPNTQLRLTEKGREAFKNYTQKMKQVFNEITP
ncbi:MAG: transcriptional regulator [Anaerolineaceae bacterium]|nr:transcriptional regulator [Anaerolineaceae bacterium]